MDHRSLLPAERDVLLKALNRNMTGGTILMNRRDTSFAGSADEVPEEEVVNAIKSVPVHYA